MHTARRIQGRLVQAEEILWLRGWVDLHPQWSRKRLARELCLEWQWLDGHGRLKDFAARSFLLKLEGPGQISLPALQGSKRRLRRGVEELASGPGVRGASARLHNDAKNSASAACHGRCGGSLVLSRMAFAGRVALRGKCVEGTGNTVTFRPAIRKISCAKSNQLTPPLLAT